MGNRNSCSANKNNKDYSNLSDYDKTVFLLKQDKVYWGTIAICLTYAFFAIVLFMLAVVSNKLRFLLLNNYLPFVVVYIIGTILIILILSYQVANFEPVKIQRNYEYDNLSCPDYWKLEKTNLNIESDEQKSLFDKNTNINLFTYKCVMDPEIFSKQQIAFNTSGLQLANASLINDKPTSSKNSDGSTLDSDMYYLYANLINSNNIYYKDIGKSNVNVTDLLKHSLIMNNYTNIGYSNNKLLFEYNINPINSNLANNLLNIRDIKYDIDASRATLTEFIPQTNKYIEIETTDDKKHINGFKFGASSNAITTAHPVVPLVCDRFYPLYLATKDIELTKDNPNLDQNVLRCAYSKICGIPWSDLNCSKYES